MSVYFDGSQANNNTKASNHLKSKARLKDILLNMVNSHDAIKLLYSQPSLVIENERVVGGEAENLFNINVTADGEDTISQFVELIFSQALLLGMSNTIFILVMPNDYQIGLNIGLVWEDGYFKELSMLGYEHKSVTHTMCDVDDMLRTYGIDSLQPTDSQLDIRAKYTALGKELRKDKQITHVSLSSEKYNCLIER